MNLQGIWSDIEKGASAHVREGILRRRILPESRCDLYIGVQHPGNKRLFLISVNKTAADKVSQVPRTRGCEVGRTQLPEDPSDKVSFWLLLTDARYTDVFSSLVEDISLSLSVIDNDTALLETFITRLKQWQSFLDRHAPEGLDEEAQRGLFGELWFLNNHLLPLIGPAASVKSWTGPENAIHDFRFAPVSIEVKTTIAKQHTKFLVANERQLDTANVTRLFLVHLSLDSVMSGGATLPEMVGALRAGIADPGVHDRFEDLLRTGGYFDAHAVRYEPTRYAIRSLQFFDVRDGFPRMTPKDIPLGVGDLIYTVMVGQCQPFLIQENEAHALIKGTNLR